MTHRQAQTCILTHQHTQTHTHLADDRLVVRVDGGEHLAVAAVPELAVDVELGWEADVHLVHVHLHRCVLYNVFMKVKIMIMAVIF